MSVRVMFPSKYMSMLLYCCTVLVPHSIEVRTRHVVTRYHHIIYTYPKEGTQHARPLPRSLSPIFCYFKPSGSS